MKIAYLTSSFLPKVGGAEIFTHSLAEAVAVRGHDVTVVTPSAARGYRSTGAYQLIRLSPLVTHALLLNFALGRPYLHALLDNVQKRYGFDVWHMVIGYPLGAASVDFFHRHSIPCVLRCSGEDLQTHPELRYGYRLRKDVDRVIREQYKKFDVLIAASEGMKSDYRSVGVPEEKIRVITNGVTCSRFHAPVDTSEIRRELGVGAKEKLILTVGRNHPKKGFTDIPKIIAHMRERRSDFKWLLVGKGCEEIAASASRQGLGAHVIVRHVQYDVSRQGETKVPGEKLIEYYKTADVFVFPTMIEMFAKVIIEALAAGLPVVTTDAAGADDIIRHEANGLKCRAGDVEQMAQAIIRILSDEGLGRNLRENARRHAAAYDWSNITAQYEELYSKLITV